MMEGMCFMIAKETIMLLSGIPATRKSSFGRYLATEHRFAHYDIECYPIGPGNPHNQGSKYRPYGYEAQDSGRAIRRAI